MKALVYARRNWSLYNIAPVLNLVDNDILIADRKYNIKDYDVLLSCDPTNADWSAIYNQYKNTIPIIGMQQSLSFNPCSNLKAYWPIPNLMIWGSRYTYHYKSNNFKGKLFITGLPKFDIVYNMQKTPEDYILFLPLVGNRHIKHMLPYINRVATKMSVKVKFHPQQDNIPRIDGVECIKGDSKSVLKLIQKAKAVVISTSSAGIQSMILGVPTLSIGSIEKRWAKNYEKAEIELKYKEDILDGLERVINEQPNERNKIFLRNTVNGKRATEKVIHTIEKVITNA